VHNHPRNLPDDVIDGVAASGGVIGITAVSRFVTGSVPGIGQWVDHLDYIVQRVGIDFVGVGADFADYLYRIGASHEIAGWNPEQPMRSVPFQGMLSPEDLPSLTAELIQRGYTEADLTSVLNRNYLRVMTSVLSGSLAG
jgi:membrane dipeptidase